MAKGSAMNEASLGAVAGGGHARAVSETAKAVEFISDVGRKDIIGEVIKENFENGMLDNIQDAMAPGTKMSNPVKGGATEAGKRSMDVFKAKEKG